MMKNNCITCPEYESPAIDLVSVSAENGFAFSTRILYDDYEDIEW